MYIKRGLCLTNKENKESDVHDFHKALWEDKVKNPVGKHLSYSSYYNDVLKLHTSFKHTLTNLC